MAQIHAGKMIPFELIPVDGNGVPRKLEGPAVVTVEDPAEIRQLSEDGLSGFVANPFGEGVSVKFTASGDGKLDNNAAFDIEYEASIDLLAPDAVAFQTNVFGDEVDIS